MANIYNPLTAPPRAFGYCRKSTNEQREESLEAQQRAIVTFATTAGYELVKVYKDHGNSGRRGERPEFQQMLADAKEAGVQYIIVHKLDRFFRNADQQTVVEMDLRRHGIQVISAAEHFDNSPQGQFMRNITKAINQWYSANLAQEVVKGMRENALTARSAGGVAPLGYAVDKSTGKFVIVPREAEAVQMIFTMYLQGCGYSEIIDALNSGGYVTRRGKPFGKGSLYDILRNEKYTGLYIWNRLAPADADGRSNHHRSKPRADWVCIENGMPQIIPPDQWQAVQDAMERRRHRNAAYAAKNFYLLSGLVYCGGCGGPMAGETHRYGRNGSTTRYEYKYYRCGRRGRLHENGGTHVRRVYADDLEKAVVEYLQRIVLDPVNMDALCAAVLQSMQPDERNVERAAELKKDADAIQQKIDRLYQAIEQGLDMSSAIDRINALQKQRLALLARANDLDMSNEQAAVNIDQLRRVWSSINLSDLSPQKLRAVINELVYKIIVFDEGSNGHRVRIILNPARIRPDIIPNYIESASFSELENIATKNGKSLPLPSICDNWLIFDYGLIVTEFSLVR